MKRIYIVLIAVMLSAAAAAQGSVADAARKARSEHHGTATVRVDGDSLPQPVRSSDAEKPAGAKPADAKPADSKDQAKAKPDAQKQKADEMGKKLEDVKKEIATLRRELDILQR